jgi:hypothetical protein
MVETVEQELTGLHGVDKQQEPHTTVVVEVEVVVMALTQPQQVV